MGGEHIAPEEAYHSENVDDRTDDKKRLDIVLRYRAVQLNKRKRNGVKEVREQINRRGNSVSLFFIVVVADKMERLSVCDKKYKQYTKRTDHKQSHAKNIAAVKALQHLCPVAELSVGVGRIQNTVAQEVAEAHAVMHYRSHQNERSAQRTEPELFEDDQQDSSDNYIHQRRAALIHHLPDEGV